MIEHVREHGLNYLGYGGAGGSGLWALAQPSWVPLCCALIAITPAVLDRAIRVYQARRDERGRRGALLADVVRECRERRDEARSTLLADNVRLRSENERLRLLLAPIGGARDAT